MGKMTRQAFTFLAAVRRFAAVPLVLACGFLAYYMGGILEADLTGEHVRGESGFVGRVAGDKRLILLKEGSEYVVDLVKTKGLPKPLDGDIYVAFLDGTELEVCPYPLGRFCYTVNTSGSPDLVKRLAVQESLGEEKLRLKAEAAETAYKD